MSITAFVGAYGYARRVLQAIPPQELYAVLTVRPGYPMWEDVQEITPPWAQVFLDEETFWAKAEKRAPGIGCDLVVVAGWRRLVPIVAPTVGFHSAKLPEYPGRAPVANAILRGDKTLTNTMLWLDGGVDSGDIIDSRTFPLGTDPAAAYVDIGRTSAEMLRQHWSGLLDGTAPRHPQDMSKRGPLTPKDAYRRLEART